MQLTLLLLTITLSLACKPKETKIFSLIEKPTAVSLYKDDVLLVNGGHLSITGFLNIRSQMKDQLNKEKALWVSIATMTILYSPAPSGLGMSPHGAVDVARYAIGDLPLEKAQSSLRDYLGYSKGLMTTLASAKEVKKMLDLAISKATIQKNVQILSDIQ
jgi:hypothetical protein